MGKIHIGKKQFFDVNADYRDMFQTVGGVRIPVSLDEAGRGTVIEHVKA